MALIIGKTAEACAAHYLIERGYRVVAQNVRYPFGELDIVAHHKETLVFCEVKYRKTSDYGSPFEAVGRQKQKKIILAAKAYLTQNHKTLPACRFDVIAVEGDLNHPVIEHLEDAFWDEG